MRNAVNFVRGDCSGPGKPLEKSLVAVGVHTITSIEPVDLYGHRLINIGFATGESVNVFHTFKFVVNELNR